MGLSQLLLRLELAVRKAGTGPTPDARDALARPSRPHRSLLSLTVRHLESAFDEMDAAFDDMATVRCHLVSPGCPPPSSDRRQAAGRCSL